MVRIIFHRRASKDTMIRKGYKKKENPKEKENIQEEKEEKEKQHIQTTQSKQCKLHERIKNRKNRVDSFLLLHYTTQNTHRHVQYLYILQNIYEFV